MQYRDFCGEKVSVLGFGGMRFPITDNKIDREKSVKMLMRAYENGVNYYDTAYFYHEQDSEVFFGEAFEKIRKNIYIATKSPVYAIENDEDFDKFFQNQLRRLRTDYIDFYLLHALDRNTWENKVKKFNLVPKLLRLKELGLVHHIGFSFHDSFEIFKEIIDYTDEWEFCQIQYNYIDIENQAGRKGVEYAYSKEINLIVMEPLLGGKLASPPPMVEKALSAEKKPVEWALDFVWSHKEISLLLSGMSTEEQVEDNIKYAQKAQVDMLSNKDTEMLLKAREVYLNNAYVSCTKCLYCMPCPFGLDIPAIYDAYNSTVTKGIKKSKEIYEKIEYRADACQKCGACTKRCPQGINPEDFMDKIAEIFK